MRILHIIIGLNVGGAERALQSLILAHKGSSAYMHEVVSLSDAGMIGEELLKEGVPLYSLGLHGWKNLPAVLWRLYKILRDNKPDIVQTRMYHADFLGGIVARLAGITNIVWGIHSSDTSFPGTYSAKWIFRACALIARFVPSIILCVSQEGAKKHIKAGYPKEKIMSLPNGFNEDMPALVTKTTTEFRNEIGVAAEVFLVGLVARFNQAKDVQNFVKASGILAKEESNVCFILIGAGLDAENDTLCRWIYETGQRNHFILCGERQDIPNCMAAMDCLCLSSRTEAFPGVLGEALMLETPCVSTNVGDAALILGDAGILVPAENAEALAAGMKSMLSLPKDVRQEMGKKGRKHIQENYSMKAMMKRYEAVMKGLMEYGK